MTESDHNGTAADDAEATEPDEQVLAQALRAQAGLDISVPVGAAASEGVAPEPGADGGAPEKPPLPTRWVLLLALLLGLAAGAVVGLLSLF